MTTHHVIDDFGVEVFKSEDAAAAKRAADHGKASKLNGSTNFHVERRERVYTTSTLEEAIKDTPFDPNFNRDSGDEHAINGDRQKPVYT